MDKFVDKGYGKRIVGCYAVGVPLVAAGLVLCATIVLSPVGFLLIIASGIPLYLVQKTHLRRRQEWENRDHPMPGQGAPPWLMDANSFYVTGRIEPDA
jgi:hypothetical protein